ncbi:MAG: cation:proton antiporter [Helicobacter sp.]|mgnify:CR=1 FL=1|nr:cation:proton antiporter [Helicobacter sp.]
MEAILFDHFVSFAIICALIILAPFFSKALKTPIVVVEIILGALGVYFGILHENEVVEIFAKIGFLFLMFLCGMEVELNGFKKQNKGFFKKVAFYFVITYGLTIIGVLSLNLPHIFIVALPVMSVGMMVTLIRDYGKNNNWLNMSLQIGIIGELISIGVLVAINGIYRHGIGLELAQIMLALVLFIAIIASFFIGLKILFWWFPVLRELIMPSISAQNEDIRVAIMLFFLLIVIVMFLDLEPALGAFLAGMIIANFFPYKHELIHKLNDIGFGFFVPLFFISVGMALQIELVLQNPKILYFGALIAISMLALHLIASIIVFRRAFRIRSNLFLHAFANCIPLTFLVATATLGFEIGALSQDFYYSFLLAALFEGIFFVIAIKLIYNFSKLKDINAIN